MPLTRTDVTTNVLPSQNIVIDQTNEDPLQPGTFFTYLRTVAHSSSVAQHERVAVDPNVLGGQPFIRGTRIPITTIWDALAEGLSPEQIMEHYPRLTLEDIRAAMEYRAAMALSPQE